MSVFAAFFYNLGIPRSGEFLRASLIYYYDKIPFEKTFGTIISERIIDVLILFLCILCAINISSKIKFPYVLDLNLFIYLLAILVFMYFVIRKVMRITPKLFVFIDGLKEGVLSISRIENNIMFYTHTLFIWSSYFLMIYIVKFSIPETSLLGIEPIFIAFVAGVISMSITNGGIGVYPLAIAAIINQYDVAYEYALAFGWIVWISQTFLIIIMGSLSFILIPIINKK